MHLSDFSQTLQTMKTIRLLLFVSLLFGAFFLKAQTNPPDTADYPYWIEMMQDERVNFFDVVRAFETYWKDRPITKGCGWKPFKRWEYMMRNGRIFPDGTRKPASWNWDAYHSYQKLGRNADNGNWTSIGPFNYPSLGYKGLGRVNAVGFHPTDPSTFYIGAPAGGVWHTNDGGVTWNSDTDVLPTLGVSAIVVSYSDPNLVYIGTGDRDAGDAAGLGVMRSTDGGQNWEMWNNGMGDKTVGRMIQHPSNPLILLAATSGGIYKTIDEIGRAHV